MNATHATSSQPTLHHQLIKAPNAQPGRYMLALHGIYGMGRNWATFAQMLVKSRPRWGVYLIDLRLHGRSVGFAPPHTLQACANDLHALVEDLNRTEAHRGHPPLDIRGIMGHSFGGKVAMTYARQFGLPLDEVWVLDSTPEAFRSATSPLEVLKAMRQVPMPQPSRQAVTQALLALGQPESIASWLATNVEHREGSYHWRFDFDGLEALMLDFYQTDLWSMVEEPPYGFQLHFVKAERSDVLSVEGERRVQEASLNGRTFLHILPDSGHWLHVDNPQGLLDLMELYL